MERLYDQIDNLCDSWLDHSISINNDRSWIDMIMTTELYERMNDLCDARVMFDDEQQELEQTVFDAMTAVAKAEALLEFYEAKNHYQLKEYRKKVLTQVA